MKSEIYMLYVRGKLVPGTRDNIKEAVRESYEQLFSPDSNLTVSLRREPTLVEREALKDAYELDYDIL